MNDCPHNWLTPGDRLAIIEILEDWLGPTLAIIRCSHCNSHALLHLVAWQGQGLNQRIYAARPIPTDVVTTYLENVARDYCDLDRKQQETDTLVQMSDNQAALLAVELPALDVRQVSGTKHNPKPRDWQSITAEEYPRWQAMLA